MKMCVWGNVESPSWMNDAKTSIDGKVEHIQHARNHHRSSAFGFSGLMNGNDVHQYVLVAEESLFKAWHCLPIE